MTGTADWVRSRASERTAPVRERGSRSAGEGNGSAAEQGIFVETEWGGEGHGRGGRSGEVSEALGEMFGAGDGTGNFNGALGSARAKSGSSGGMVDKFWFLTAKKRSEADEPTETKREGMKKQQKKG